MSALSRERWLAASPHLERALEVGEEERARMLAELHAVDPRLADDVEALLEESGAVDRERFLEANLGLAPLAGSVAGQRIGAYTLVRQIGQGGMGGVWLAQRSDGRFEGNAAVKLLNPGLIGRAGEERFRREGSFLARLAHPNIARLLDAGVSSAGQPYLVLEYVDGERIDTCCDSRGLDLEARLRLFLDVLAAVGHAHSNLIVHRDIKPSNVLVGKDGRVRLLDFGIAKLLEDGAEIGETTALTREAGQALTPEYAAPEQLTGGAITTATDVYTLGVLLYVLLTGQHPAETARRSTADLVNAVVHGEPRRLSACVSDTTTLTADTLAENAARRATTPEGLRRALEGDLDTVVAKALKKKPEERYESVGAFADDLRRYLREEPVSARPDTLTYRAGKFIRRHAQGVLVAGAAAVVLSLMVFFHTVRLAAERDRARMEADKATQVSRVLTDLLTGADPWGDHKGGEVSVRALLDAGAGRIEKELANQPELQAAMLTVMGRVYERLGVFDRAQALLEKGLDVARRAYGPGDARVAESLNDLGVLLDQKGDYLAATTMLEQALEIRRKTLGREHKDVAVTLVELGRVESDRGRDDRAEPLFREALAIRRKLFGEVHHETATSENELGLLLWRRGNLGEAETLFRRVLDTDRKTSGGEHPDVGAPLNNLALIAMQRGDFAAAEPLLRQAIAITGKALGERHPSLLPVLNNLSNALREEGKIDEAAAVARETLDKAKPALGAGHPLVALCDVTLARADLARGRAAAAEPLLRDALEISGRRYPAGDWRIAAVQSVLGEALTSLGRYSEAEALLVGAGRNLKDGPGREGRIAKENHARLDALHRVWKPATM